MAKTIKTVKALSTRERIVQAATELFLNFGYGNTSLDDVAEKASVTKPTVYSHFGSKEGLLTAITKAHASANVRVMSAALLATGDVRIDLLHFAEIFTHHVLSAEADRWRRLAMTESAKHPEVGQALYRAGPAQIIAALTSYIEGEVAAGRLKCSDAVLAAEQFLGLVIGISPMRRLIGFKNPTKAQQQRINTEAVNTFLAAFGV